MRNNINFFLKTTSVCIVSVCAQDTPSSSSLSQGQSTAKHVADQIVSHMQKHKYLSWKQDFPQMQLEQEIVPHNRAIKNSIQNRYPPAPHVQPVLSQRGILTANNRSKIPKFIYKAPKQGFIWHTFHLPYAAPETPESVTIPGDTQSSLKKSFDEIGSAINAYQHGKTAFSDYTTEMVQLFCSWTQNAYKIHLMPDSQDLINTVVTLLREYEKLPKKQQHITSIKFSREIRVGLNSTIPATQESVAFIMPRIVIYPVTNKQAAEKTLQWLLNIFSHQKGIDMYPRFNHRVTSFIYYSQGHGGARLQSPASYAFDPNTGYTFINTDAIKQAAQRAGIPIEELGLHTTQKLIHPDTGKPF